MIDYIEKARAGRTTALSLHTDSHGMFFPDECEASARKRRSGVQISKAMFVRSAAFDTGALNEADAPANNDQDAFILTEDHIVEEVMRRAA
jgi:hypothetical protein